MLLATETRVHWRLLFASFKKNKWEEKSWKFVGKYFKKLCGPLSRRFIVVAWVAGVVMVLMMFRKNSLNWLESFRQSFSKVKFLEFFTNFPPILSYVVFCVERERNNSAVCYIVWEKKYWDDEISRGKLLIKKEIYKGVKETEQLNKSKIVSSICFLFDFWFSLLLLNFCVINQL